jgi:hypothetical protein
MAMNSLCPSRRLSERRYIAETWDFNSNPELKGFQLVFTADSQDASKWATTASTSLRPNHKPRQMSLQTEDNNHADIFHDLIRIHYKECNTNATELNNTPSHYPYEYLNLFTYICITCFSLRAFIRENIFTGTISGNSSS